MDEAATLEALSGARERIHHELGKAIVGQRAVIEQILVSMLTGGNCLITGAPGLAKTLLVKSLAEVFKLQFNRIQFTPDLMPADILGSEVLETAADGTRAFRFVQGPVFCELLMADEINRASPRTQSALLQAMQEREVTIAGQSRRLGPPFHVLATQNPIEQEGTYPLPEAQLDRFLVQVDVAYPTRAAERDILLATTGAQTVQAAAVLSAADLMAAQALVRQMPVGDLVVEAILDLVRACRPTEEEGRALQGTLAWGPGPRAAQALMLMVRARALLQGRLAPTIADIRALAQPVLGHRMALGFAARARGDSLAHVIATLCDKVLPA